MGSRAKRERVLRRVGMITIDAPVADPTLRRVARAANTAIERDRN